MDIEQIEKFLTSPFQEEFNYVKIYFKKREAIYGIFVKDADYAHLKSKNFWRIVTRAHFDEYKESKNMSLSRIFNGSQISKLVSYKESFEKTTNE